MSSLDLEELEIGEPRMKRERVDNELEMLNYETPMQIYVPENADDEVDPLAVDTNEESCDSVSPLGLTDFIRPIKYEHEIEGKFPCEMEEAQSNTPRIDAVIPNFEFSRSELKSSVVIESSDPLDQARSDSTEPACEEEQERCVPDASEVEEITIEPKSEITEDDVADDSLLKVGAEGPEIGQLYRFQQPSDKTQSLPLLRNLLLNRQMPRELDQLLVQDRAVSNAAVGQESVTVSKQTAEFVSVRDRCETRPTPAHTLGDKQLALGNQCPVPTPTLPSAAATIPPSLQKSTRDPLISEPVSVSRLLADPFLGGTWTREQKNAIIKLSRPKPEIDTLKTKSAKHFYNRISWLCGSSSLRKFFCWPCLLFSYFPNCAELLWSVLATSAEEPGFESKWHDHAATYTHVEAEKELASWLPNLNLSSKPNQTPRVRNNIGGVERARRNRKLLSLLVQSICYLKKENNDASMKDYAECFDYVSSSNLELREALIELQGTSSKESSSDFVFKHGHQVEDAIEKMMNSNKSEELKKTRFVTLFMEDFSGIVDVSNVAFIVHFVDQTGEIQERIIEIIEIGSDRSADAVFSVFQRIIGEFGLRLKVAGFTYSPTLVHPTETAAFNERVERVCPTARFFHYQKHNLTGMLFGALSHLNGDCKNFFHTMTELREFFKKHLVLMFQHFEQLNCSDPAESYDYEHGFVLTLKKSYSAVLETFKSILARPQEWDSAVSAQAPVFMSFLQDHTTRFLIVLISQLNVAIMEVSLALQGKIDTAEWKQLVRCAIANLISLKKCGLEDAYVTSLNPFLVWEENSEKTSGVPSGVATIFKEIIDTAIAFLRQRFDSVDFGYVDLESVAMRYYTRLRLSPEDIQKFRQQIQLLAREPMLTGKSLGETLKLFYTYNLGVAVPEYATFLNFSMTIPSSRSCIKCPVVDRILSLRTRSNKQTPPKKWIWLENELLADILKLKKYREAVIDILVAEKGMKEFSYSPKEVGDLISQSKTTGEG